MPRYRHSNAISPLAVILILVLVSIPALIVHTIGVPGFFTLSFILLIIFMLFSPSY